MTVVDDHTMLSTAFTAKSAKLVGTAGKCGVEAFVVDFVFQLAKTACVVKAKLGTVSVEKRIYYFNMYDGKMYENIAVSFCSDPLTGQLTDLDLDLFVPGGDLSSHSAN